MFDSIGAISNIFAVDEVTQSLAMALAILGTAFLGLTLEPSPSALGAIDSELSFWLVRSKTV